MLLAPTPILSSHFTYDPETKRFIGEASTLAGNANCPGPLRRLGRVYDDACDVGFTLVSAKTGTAIVCAMEREVRDSERELLYTVFVPVDARGPLGRIGDLPFEVRIYND